LIQKFFANFVDQSLNIVWSAKNPVAVVQIDRPDDLIVLLAQNLIELLIRSSFATLQSDLKRILEVYQWWGYSFCACVGFGT
jgi:hypothetical protein